VVGSGGGHTPGCRGDGPPPNGTQNSAQHRTSRAPCGAAHTHPLRQRTLALLSGQPQPERLQRPPHQVMPLTGCVRPGSARSRPAPPHQPQQTNWGRRREAPHGSQASCTLHQGSDKTHHTGRQQPTLASSAAAMSGRRPHAGARLLQPRPSARGARHPSGQPGARRRLCTSTRRGRHPSDWCRRSPTA